MTDEGHARTTNPARAGRSWFWMVRRLFGLLSPLIVLALALLIYSMFDGVPEDENGMIDLALVYGAALISPMGVVAFVGYACANSTRGRPAPLLGKISSATNLVLAAVLTGPAVCLLPFFLRAAPVMVPELIAWIGFGFNAYPKWGYMFEPIV